MPIPEPTQGETEAAFMARCVPVVIRDGLPSEQAVAVCSSAFAPEGVQAGAYKKKRKREALPDALDCDPVTIEPGDITTPEAGVTLHAWAHQLWPMVRGTAAAEGVLEMHADAVALGAHAGVPHVDCDSLDGEAYARMEADHGEGALLAEAFKLTRLMPRPGSENASG